MAYLIYIVLCVLNSVTLASADIHIEDWQFWAIVSYVAGAYLCGLLKKK